MNRIQTCFATAKAAGRPVFIAYLTAGFPTLADSLAAADILLANGAGILEIGIPAHDPAADGPVLRRAATVALTAGVTTAAVFGVVRALRARHPETPLILFAYYDTIDSYGLDAFAQAAAAAGADAVLAVGTPPDQAVRFAGALHHYGLATVPLLPPGAAAETAAQLAKDADGGFLYAITAKGTTGARAVLPAGLTERLRAVRTAVDLPVVAGFGLHTREQILEVCSACDGFVIGSALAAVLDAGAPEELAAFARTLVG